jgi:hypothetical protein
MGFCVASTTPTPKRARLLHQRDQRPLGGRVRAGAAEESRTTSSKTTSARRRCVPGGPTHPGEELFEQHAQHQRALVVVEVRDAHDHAGVLPSTRSASSTRSTSRVVALRQAANVGDASRC